MIDGAMGRRMHRHVDCNPDRSVWLRLGGARRLRFEFDLSPEWRAGNGVIVAIHFFPCRCLGFIFDAFHLQIVVDEICFAVVYAATCSTKRNGLLGGIAKWAIANRLQR